MSSLAWSGVTGSNCKKGQNKGYKLNHSSELSPRVRKGLEIFPGYYEHDCDPGYFHRKHKENGIPIVLIILHIYPAT